MKIAPTLPPLLAPAAPRRSPVAPAQGGDTPGVNSLGAPQADAGNRIGDRRPRSVEDATAPSAMRDSRVEFYARGEPGPGERSSAPAIERFRLVSTLADEELLTRGGRVDIRV